jgi:MFS family permease
MTPESTSPEPAEVNAVVVDAAAMEAAASPSAAAPWRATLRGQVGGLPRAFWWLWVGTLVNRAGTFIEPFLVLYLTGPRDISIRTAGVVLTVWGVGALVSQPIGGALTDRFGRRATLAVTLTATALALAALGFARGLGLITVLAFVLGTVGDMYRPASSAAITDLVTGTDRVRAFALQFWAINLGFSVASVSAGLLLHAGFELLFVLDAATTFAFGMIALRFVPETRPDSDEAPPRLADPLRMLARDRLLLAATLLTLAYAVLYIQVTVVLPLAITSSGLSASIFGYVIAINGVLIVVGQPLTISWLARLPRARTLPCGIALVTVGVAATSLCHATWQFALTVVVWSVGEIATAGSFPALVAALSPPNMRGRYAGAFGLAWGASGLLGPALGAMSFATSSVLTAIGCLALGSVAAVGQYRLLRSPRLS